ncbi:NAD(+) diphosphatase [Methylopila turkensis]|uniref:NAD(+) diphosphatase n=1 Tax=Methylopila turkensis TaxID=1437816 RepID=A0A9W6JLR1_9HYPH|nr:NAD(+) diphosphatase [Methylopila turkensis]GLK79502.1 NADH pyrophosphatase [Methylopila turkensis]
MTDALPAPDLADLGYAGLALDRCGERRDRPGFLDRVAADPRARFALFLGERAVLSEKGGALDPLFDRAAAVAFGAPAQPVFLGLDGDVPRFAAELDADVEASLPPGVAVEDLRAVASDGRLAGSALALAGYAKSMLRWHARNGFCANCGAPSVMAGGGWRRVCPACGAVHFPRTDPVAIMLVTHGGRCLLGRQARFRPGMWSCLAGFVEPGETLEDAVRRETFEEAGVRVGRVAYAFSQPWPFPSQLMVGMVGEALDDALDPDLEELEDARWFSREDARRMLAGDHPEGLTAPPPAAIAHHLLRAFVAG